MSRFVRSYIRSVLGTVSILPAESKQYRISSPFRPTYRAYQRRAEQLADCTWIKVKLGGMN